MDWNKDYKPGIEHQDRGRGRFDWKFALLTDETLLYDPCPECGCNVLNTEVAMLNQYESSETRGVSRDLQLKTATCNECHTLIYDSSRAHKDQPMIEDYTKTTFGRINEVQLPSGQWWELKSGQIWFDYDNNAELELVDQPTDAIQFENLECDVDDEAYRMVDMDPEVFVENVRDGRLHPVDAPDPRMPRVTFEIPVKVDRMHLSDDPDEEELVDAAKEIVYSAPAFDSIKEYAIDNIFEVGDVNMGNLVSNDDKPHVSYEDDRTLWVRYTTCETLHEFKFSLVHYDEWDANDRDDRVAWPETLVQGGESYSIGVDDVPENVEHAVEEEGYKLEDG